jgi:hypothetical protein
MMLPQAAAIAFCSAVPDLGEKGIALHGGMSERGRELLVKKRWRLGKEEERVRPTIHNKFID